MKFQKMFALIIVSIFLLSSAGFCDTSSSMADSDQHCVSCCNAGCHSVVLTTQQTAIPFFSQEFIPFETALRQELFVRGIEYPPKSII